MAGSVQAAYGAFLHSKRKNQPYGDFEAFRREHAAWLPDYARFSAMKEHFKGRPWWEWPAEVRTAAGSRRTPAPPALAARSEAFEFIQYLFFGQWAQLRTRAAKLGIAIIGDAPIFAA